jgi:hypothetical protein
MIRIYIFCILGMYLFPVSAQEFNFIYVDKSAIGKIDLLQKQIVDLYGAGNETTMLFISNDKKPMVATSVEEMKSVVKELSYIRSGAPSPYFEVDTINHFFSKYDLEKLKCSFMFVLSMEQAISQKQLKYIVDRVMLTNGIYTKTGVMQNCSVKLYFEKSEISQKAQTLEYIKEIKNNPHYEVYEY